MTTDTAHSPTHLLDTKGLKCPEPVMLLHAKVRAMATGEMVEVLATDPSTTRDIPRFCQFLGHELVSQMEQDGIDGVRVRIGQRAGVTGA